MSVEAELKAHIREPEHVRAALRALAAEQVSVYRDTYYDLPDRSLDTAGRELRVRVIDNVDGRRAVLTYKAAAVHASGAKPEHETEIADPEIMDTILSALGYAELIAFTKSCRNYQFSRDGRDLLATLVHIPELDSAFLEIETIVPDADQVDAALTVIRSVLTDLGIGEDYLTTELYTDAVRLHRGLR